ncbi:polysaccharide biosynthesis protein [bacterium]|nr:polysaccharide biosynthesis protein [bacterium]
MLDSIKRLTKHSFIYGLGHIFTRSIGFLLLPIHTNYLDTDIMGVAALLFSSLALANVLFGYGMDTAFLRYFILEESRNGKQKIFSTAFLMVLSTGVLFSLVIFLFPADISRMIFRTPAYPHLIRLAAGILLADALALLPFLVLRGEEKSIQFGALKFVNVLANLLMNIWLVAGKKWGLTGVFTANFVASFVSLLTVLPVIAAWLRPRFSAKTLKDLLRFGLPYIPSMLSVLIMDQISRFFLDRMMGKDATGIFSASYKLGMFMALVVAAFRFAWHPFFLSTSKQKDARKVFARILTYFILVTGGFYIIISFFINEIVTLKLFGFTIIGAEYTPGIPIVPVVMLAYICYGVYVNFIVGIYLKKKTASLPIVTGIGAAVSLAGNYFLIPSFGIMGAAWSAFLAYAAMAASLYLYSRRLYPVPYEWVRIGKLVAILGLLFYAGTVVFADSRVLVRAALLLLFPVLLYLSRFFTADEKRRIIRIFRHAKP